jgi:hypothetical protein
MSSSILIKTEQEVSLPVRDDPLYEVVDGQRFVLPLMSAYATWLASRLQGHLWPYIYESPTQVQILSVGDELTGGNVVSGFRLPLASLFQRFAASHATSTS